MITTITDPFSLSYSWSLQLSLKRDVGAVVMLDSPSAVYLVT